MVLVAGARLGPYEIQSPLGAGGMGEVYRAIDTRLDRTVAVKILPRDLGANPARQQRFEREARALSAVNHPHICTLYDLGEHDGIPFLVMEYVEGQTLGERLLAGPLPIQPLLQCAIDIVDALEHAHRHGIVHRDLKPANIMLTKAGVKVLDFGARSNRDINPAQTGSSQAGVLPLAARAASSGHRRPCRSPRSSRPAGYPQACWADTIADRAARCARGA